MPARERDRDDRRPAASGDAQLRFSRSVRRPGGGGMPAAESRARRTLVRASGAVALLAGLLYLTWRALDTLNLEVWWISVPLLALEGHVLLGLALYAFCLWDLDTIRPPEETVPDDARIAVLIPTYNEAIEILLPGVAAAVALEPAHETWVLDDGARPEIAEMARALGACYLAREDRAHAKAGNLNNALRVIDADFVAVLDADHVPLPGFLRRTLGYFADPRVAVVQTPQDFYNLDSFEHLDAEEGSDRVHHEQGAFYRVIQAGKNRWRGAFWCGTNAVLRVRALEEVGGVATDTITEDIHTTVRLHRRGWRSVYHNEVLARGLAASTAAQYETQRLRWGTGAMQLLRSRENPMIVPGLSLTQRLSYAMTLLGWFDAWRTLGMLLVPPAVLLTAANPIVARPATFAVAFGASWGLGQLAMVTLSRGYHRPIGSVLFELVRMTPNLRATLTLLRPGRQEFKVTHKGRTTGEPRAGTDLLLSLLAGNFVAAVWFGATLLGMTPMTYHEPWVAYGAAGWTVVNSGLLAAAIHRTRRFDGDRRRSVRWETHLPGSLWGRPCEVVDLSLTGARLAFPDAPPAGMTPASTFAVDFGGEVVRLRVSVALLRPGTGGAVPMAMVDFQPDQLRERAALARALFGDAPYAEHAGQVVPLDPSRSAPPAAPGLPVARAA